MGWSGPTPAPTVRSSSSNMASVIRKPVRASSTMRACSSADHGAVIEQSAVAVLELPRAVDVVEPVEADPVVVELVQLAGLAAERPPPGQVAQVADVVVSDEATWPGPRDLADPLGMRCCRLARLAPVAPVVADQPAQVRLQRRARGPAGDRGTGPRRGRHAARAPTTPARRRRTTAGPGARRSRSMGTRPAR